MSDKGLVVIGRDTAFEGKIRKCGRLEIYGLVKGEVSTGEFIVHEGGIYVGKAKAGSSEIAGRAQGDIVVDGLIRVTSTGVVAGNLHYGKLAIEPGADLMAEVRNVPPRLLGDFEITVGRGRTVRITTEDITAIDPDNTAEELTFTVSNAVGGSVLATNGPTATFTQADLIGGRVLFRHDGSPGTKASFDVAVTDTAGGSSGDPKTVSVKVTG